MFSAILARLRPNSLRARLTLWYLVILGGTLTALAAFVFLLQARTLARERDKELKDTLRKGSPGVAKLDPRRPDPPLKMPGWGDRLTEGQLDDLVAYLLSLFPKEAASTWR